MTDILNRHRDTWNKKKILRLIYIEWYKQIINDLFAGKGKSVELGAGSGNFKEFKPDVISADIDPQPWLDMVFDAHQMPFKDGEIGNIVMIDVLHHLAHPVHFLDEAWRVLEKGGRIILLEPYPAFFSLMVYKRFHPEPFIFDVDYFLKDEIEEKDPWDSNQAMAHLLFYRHLTKFNNRFDTKLRIISKKRMSCILYPLSGGFENKALIPDFLIPLFRLVEWLFIPLRKWFAFRCYVVLEKQ
jgi:SAM-dependent methyltransferase